MVSEEFLASLNEADRIPRWQKCFARDISVFVAADVQGELGFAGVVATRKAFPAYDAELYTISSPKGTQGHGIGKHFLNAVLRDLSRRTIKACSFGFSNKIRAIHFYEKCGAERHSSKQIEVGGAQLPEAALGWPDLQQALSDYNSVD